MLPVVPLLAGLGAAKSYVLDEDNRAEQVQQATHRRHARELQPQFMAQVRREQTELDVQRRSPICNWLRACSQRRCDIVDAAADRPAAATEPGAARSPALLSAAGIDVGPFTLEAQATSEPITLPSSSADMLDSIWIPYPPIDSDSPNGAVIDDEAWTVERFLVSGRTDTGGSSADVALVWGSGGSDSSAKPPSTASDIRPTWALSCLTGLTWPLSRLSITT